jgi:hypothetical protein
MNKLYEEKASESIRLRALCSDVNPTALEILPGIYLGSIKTALSKPLLKSLGITHILCAAKDMNPFFPKVPSFLYSLVKLKGLQVSLFTCKGYSGLEYCKIFQPFK